MTAAPPGTGLDRLIVQIAAAVNKRALYGEGHPSVARAVQGTLDALAGCCNERRQAEVTFLIVGDDLVVDLHPLRTGSLFQSNFVQSLRRRGVERLTLARGLGAEECAAFISAMAEGRAPAGSAHLIVGRVEVATAAGQEAGSPGTRSAEPVSEDQLDQARDAYARFRKDRRGSIHRMEEMVWGLMETMARSAQDTLPLAPLKSHDDYTFVHAVNVSLLVLAQGRSFGLQGPLLHNLGLSAACHDIGKLDIPFEILNKPGRLEGAEWEIMTTHAEVGAWQLAATEGVPPLSVLVAYEHHLRFDGAPSYPLLATARRPTVASQLTSVADTFDAVATVRPYMKARSRPTALAILRERAGSFLDPFLVGNFHRILGAPSPE